MGRLAPGSLRNKHRSLTDDERTLLERLLFLIRDHSERHQDFDGKAESRVLIALLDESLRK